MSLSVWVLLSSASAMVSASLIWLVLAVVSEFDKKTLRFKLGTSQCALTILCHGIDSCSGNAAISVS